MSERPHNMPVRRVDNGGDIIPGGSSIGDLSNVPRDLALIKMDNDSMIAMAAARPRDYGEIIKDIKSQLQNFKSFAVSAMYAKPVGKMDKCPACGADTFYKDNCPRCNAKIPQKYARGLSIRAAESLACAYKYNRIASETIEEDDDTTRLIISFVDYQTGRMVSDSTLVSKTYKTRRGEVKRYDDDRFYGVVLKAKKSIMIRDAIMKMVPPGMRSELELCVEEQLAGFLDDNTVNAIVANFSTKNVSPEMLEAQFGKRLTNFNKDDRALLASIWTSLKDGEMTVEGIFGTGEDDKGEQGKAVDDVKAKLQAQKEAKAAAAKGPAAAPAAPKAPSAVREPAKKPAPPPPPAPEPETAPELDPADPLAPNPAIKLPPAQKPPEIAQDELEPVETPPDAPEAPSEPADDAGGLFPAEEDGEAELKDEAWSALKTKIAKIQQLCSGKPALMTSMTKSLMEHMTTHGIRGKKKAAECSLDGLNGLLQDLSELEEQVREQSK